MSSNRVKSYQAEQVLLGFAVHGAGEGEGIHSPTKHRVLVALFLEGIFSLAGII